MPEGLRIDSALALHWPIDLRLRPAFLGIPKTNPELSRSDTEHRSFLVLPVPANRPAESEWATTRGLLILRILDLELIFV